MNLYVWDLRFLRVEGGLRAGDNTEEQIGGEEAGQAGGSHKLQYSKKSINISGFLKLASQMPSLHLNEAFNFPLLFSHLPSLKTI